MARTSTEEENHNNFSHSTHEHPLERAVSGQGGNQLECSGCKMSIVAGKDYYTCRTCSFSLHRVCFNMPTWRQHDAEPGHRLLLLLAPSFRCKACGHQGSGFCYRCDICNTNYHSLCLKAPAVEKCAGHDHELRLRFFPPYNTPDGFTCDICQGRGPNQWLYRCNSCNFDVHLSCIYAAPNPTNRPRNLRTSPSQIPSPLPGNNYNPTSPSTTSPIIQAATQYTGGQITQPSGNQFGLYQFQAAPAPSTRSVLIPQSGTNMISLSSGAIPYNAAPSYHLPAYGNLGDQMGSYAYVPVMSGQPGLVDMGVPSNVAYGVRSTNQTGGFGYPQANLGGVFGGPVATGVFSGIGQGIGQGLVEVVFDGLGSSDS